MSAVLKSLRPRFIGAGTGLSLERLLDEAVDALELGHAAYLQQVSLAKSRVAHHVRTERARAMLETTDVVPGRVPAWMLSAHTFVAEWVRWTSCLRTVVAAAQVTHGHGLASGRLQIQRQAGDRLMTLRGSIYNGTIRGVIDLNEQRTGRYVDESTPRIVVPRSTIPETVLVGMDKLADRSNRGRYLSDIIDHPIIGVSDPPVTSAANVGGSVEIALEASYTTLEPVPVAAMRVVPTDADPGQPWELTARELKILRGWTR